MEQERNKEQEELQKIEDENERIKKRISDMAREYNRSGRESET